MAVALVNKDEAQMKVTEDFLQVRIHHASTSSPCRRSTRRRSGRRWCAAPSEGAAADDRLRRRRRGGAAGADRDSRSRPGGGADRQGAAGDRPGLHGPRRRRGADPEDRTLLSRRHGGRVRRLARAAGAGCRRTRDLLERPASKTRGAGRSSRARTSTVPISSTAKGNPINKRNAWQARSVLYVRLIPPGAADVAHYRVKIPKDAKRPDHVHRQAELPQVRALLHAVRLRRRAEAGSGSGARRQGPTTASSTPSIRRTFRRTSRARSRIRSRTCRSSSSRRRPRRFAWATGRRRRSGSRWSARRTASAGTTGASGCCCRAISRAPNTRSRTVTEAEPEYADGWLNVARALIQEGETDAAKPYIQKALELNPAARPQLLLQARWSKRRTAIIGGDRLAAPGHRAVSARPRGAQPDRAHPVPEARVRGGAEGAERTSARSIRRICRCTTPRCSRYRGAGNAGSGRAGGDAVPAVQGRGVGAGDHRRAAARQARKTTTSGR